VVGQRGGAVGARSKQARERPFRIAPAAAEPELLAGEPRCHRRGPQRLGGDPRQLEAEAIRRQAAAGGEDPVAPGQEPPHLRIQRPRRTPAPGCAGRRRHGHDRAATQPRGQILEQADVPPGRIEAAGVGEHRAPDRPGRHCRRVDRGGGRRGQLADQIGAAGRGRPCERRDVRAGFDRQAGRASRGERAQHVGADRRPRIDDHDGLGRDTADRLVEDRRRAPRRGVRLACLDDRGARPGLGDAAGERIADAGLRPHCAGEDERHRHDRPARRRIQAAKRWAGERST
jgi:hypothetical protein